MPRGSSGKRIGRGGMQHPARTQAQSGEMGGKLRWLLSLRLTVALLFLVVASLLRLKEQAPFPLTPLFLLAAVTCLLTVLYGILLPRLRHLRSFCGLQIGGDVLLITALIHWTGGVESPFSFLYIFSIFPAAVMLSRRSSLLAASASSIAYGLLVDLEFYGLFPESLRAHTVSASLQAGPVLFQVFVNMVAFYLVALLSSHLAERLQEAREQLEESVTDLRNLQTLHRDIVANVPSGILTLDRRGRVASFNVAAEKITGYTSSEILGKVWGETPFRSSEILSRFLGEGGSLTGAITEEITIARQDGGGIPVGLTVSSLKDGTGETVGAVVIFQDMTEKKRAQEQLRRADRLATLGHLAAGIAHEIRNPLAAISGSLQVLQGRQAISSQEKRLLDVILQEAERLKLVSGQFLSLARPPLPVERGCDLTGILEELLPLLDNSDAKNPHTKIILDRPPSAVLVRSDSDRLKQVFWNISLNALQAMPGGGELQIRVRGGKSSGPRQDRACVEFSDSGGGIAVTEVEKIFDPFYTTKGTGTGLGLAIARQIMDDLGGAIQVENRPGAGATFCVQIPLLDT